MHAAREEKLAERIAFSIEEDIAARGWPVGEVIASEDDLLATYGVSRPALRGAIRIVEHHGVARMRRGVNGGLVVCAPDPSAVTRAMGLYLDYRGVDAGQLMDVRRALESQSAEAAAHRLTATGASLLETHLREESEAAGRPVPGHTDHFHVLVARLSGNRPLELYVESLVRVMRRYCRATGSVAEAVRRSHAQHREIAEAVIAKDPDAAGSLMRHHLDELGAAIEVVDVTRLDRGP